MQGLFQGDPVKLMRLCELAENMIRKTNPGSEAESLAYLISTHKWTGAETSEPVPRGRLSTFYFLLDKFKS